MKKKLKIEKISYPDEGHTVISIWHTHGGRFDRNKNDYGFHIDIDERYLGQAIAALNLAAELPAKTYKPSKQQVLWDREALDEQIKRSNSKIYAFWKDVKEVLEDLTLQVTPFDWSVRLKSDYFATKISGKVKLGPVAIGF